MCGLLLCHIILGTLTTLRNLPVDVLIGGLDVACFAMYAAVMDVRFALKGQGDEEAKGNKILTSVR